MITSKEHDKKGNRFFKFVTDPSVEPITVDEFKLWARIDGTDEDDTLEAMITAVRGLTEKYLTRALISRNIEMTRDTWEVREIELPYSPVISLTSVVTIDEDDTETTYASSNYYLIQNEPARLAIRQDSDLPENTERSYGGFKVKYVVGYGTTASDVPQAIRDAIKLWCTYIYENRVMNLGDEPPLTVATILFPFRILNV